MGTFGLTTPLSYGTQGLGLQGVNVSPFGINPFATLPYGMTNPLTNPLLTAQLYGQQPLGIAGPWQLQQALPQIVQLLQTVPLQVQQVLQLQQIQLQQLQQLQQIVQQVIPAQLQQIQQLIQFVPQQIQHLQQTSPLQQPFGLGGFTPWAITPPAAFAQPGLVM